ncbi:MAG: FAD-dependent monooxygenase, partial [Burkholderiales bacterium]
EYTAPRVQLWMGPDAHLVAYPISAARQINVVAIVPGTWNRPGWSTPGDANELKNAFASQRWPATARMLIGAVDGWRRWALFTLPDIGEWTDGAIALLGDAAHAMLPFAAQGAAMAIEDAAVLADCLGKAPDDIAGAMRRYEALRNDRTTRAQKAASRNGLRYQASGVEAAVRNTALRMMGGAGLLKRYDWLYSWRMKPPESK